jgi:hypothetical protein
MESYNKMYLLAVTETHLIFYNKSFVILIVLCQCFG